jgi:uncharacterized repeat protein (TIGR01451 family)
VPDISVQISPQTTTVASGSNVVFTVNVTNSGSFNLTNVSISDPNLPTCNNSLGNLAVGASQNYTCTATNLTSNFTHSATASGTAPDSTVVSDIFTASITVTAPPPGNIIIVKQANPESGQSFTFNGSNGLGAFALVDDGSSIPPVNVQINFQLPGAVPAGYVADAGAAYGTVGTYGWVREDSLANPVATPIDASLNARTRTTVGFSLEQNSLMHLHGSGGTTLATPVAWEYAIPNGIYTVTVSAGDTGFYDSVHQVNVEGIPAIASFIPNSGDR